MGIKNKMYFLDQIQHQTSALRVLSTFKYQCNQFFVCNGLPF